MKLKDLSMEEIESMSYGELAEVVLTEKGTAMKIVDVFKKICKAKGMSDAEFESKIADFFELLSTDKNFIILDKGKCDLRKKHDFKVIVEDDDEEVIDSSVNEEDEIENEEENEDDIFYDSSSDEDDPTDNDNELNDFIVVDEEDEEASL